MLTFVLRLIDGLGALAAAALAALTLYFIQELRSIDLPGPIELRASSGYLTVGAMLTFAAWSLFAGLRGSFNISGHDYEANDARRGLLLKRVVGYTLLAMGGATLLLMRTALD